MRTWNLFHGNTMPPGRQNYLEEAVRLASADRPGVLCLQEVPAWALPRLGEWSGLRSFPEVAARPKIGPIPSTAGLGRRLTAIDPGLLRSAFSGQGNALLLEPAFVDEDYHALVLNPRSFRRAQGRELGLGVITRLAWAKERRVVQTVRALMPDGRRLLVANLHATAFSDRRPADAELRRTADFVLMLARDGEVVVIAGDFNVEADESRTLTWLQEQGFSAPGPHVDHVLVRGAGSSPPERWPPERRRIEGHLVSDHTPLEVHVQ